MRRSVFFAFVALVALFGHVCDALAGYTYTITKGDTSGTPVRTDISGLWVCTPDPDIHAEICCHFTGTEYVCDTLTTDAATQESDQSTSVDGAAGDTARVAYYDAIHGRLGYAFGDLNAWTFETADSCAGCRLGLYTSIATNLAHVYVSYYDSTNGNLKLATRSPGGMWSTEIVDSAANVGGYTSLINQGGVLAMSYFDFTHSKLRFASKSGVTWIRQTVDSMGAVGLFTSLVGRTPDYAISYFDVSRGDLRVARRIGGTWTVQVVDTGGVVGEYSSMVKLGLGVDSLEVAYYDRTNGNLKIARRLGGAWTTYQVAGAGDVGMGCSATTTGIDPPSDSVFVTYWDLTQARLKIFKHALLEPLPPVSVPPSPSSARAPLSCSLEPAGWVRIRYSTVTRGRYTLSVFDIQGRLVARPVNGPMDPGDHELRWRGEGIQGRLEPGIYLVELTGPGVRASARTPLLR